jgi:hypothetical protein
MRITKETYPELRHRIALWALVFLLLGAVSLFKDRLGEAKAGLAAGLILLLAVVATVAMQTFARRRKS